MNMLHAATVPSFEDPIAQTIEEGWQMPARLYADPQVYELEQELIFKDSWQCVGVLADLAKPGDYITGQLGSTPIVVVRADDGKLYGHVNVCRHRLHPVALGASGCKQLFQCRYHGWTFTHQGALRAAPGHEGCPGFEKEALGLIPVRVDTFRGFIFANANPDAEDLHSFLGSAAQLADEMGFDFTHWDRGGTLVYEIDADWKLFMENSLECYHCPLVHPTSIAAYVDTQPEAYVTREFENFVTQDAPVYRLPGDMDITGLKGFRFMFIWPCTGWSVDDFLAVAATVIPVGPQRTRFVVHTFVKPGVDPEVAREWIDVYDRTFQEDKEAVAAQQAGYKSGMVWQGRLMAHREAAIQMFQRRTWQALARDGRLASLLYGAPSTPPAESAPQAQVAALRTATPRSRSARSGKGEWEGELRIASFDLVAEGVAAITLAAPSGESLPAWQPGAHIDLILPNGLQRQYSLCGDPLEERSWRIGVLREPQSNGGSAFIHDRLARLGKVRVRGPRNHFALPEAERYRFVAGGIGVTPILAMIRQAARSGKEWTLLYGGRTRASMAFLDELEAHGDRVKVAPQDTHGLLDLAGYLTASEPDTAVCACGPGPLLDALTAVCAQIPNISLYTERFAAVVADPRTNTAFDLELRRSNVQLHVRKDQSVLEAVREAGVTVHTSCQNGVCGTCETAVLKGELDHRDAVLSLAEREAGRSMMICVSRCKSEKLVLDL